MRDTDARRLAFARLEGSLPSGPDLDMEARARAALSTLVVAALEQKDQSARLYAAPACPNCGTLADSIRTPYCSSDCKCISAFVRQFRVALEAGTLDDIERQVSFGQSFWYALGGGRPLRQFIAPASALKQVFKRTNGLCEVCGAPAVTIDHTGSG